MKISPLEEIAPKDLGELMRYENEKEPSLADQAQRAAKSEYLLESIEGRKKSSTANAELILQWLQSGDEHDMHMAENNLRRFKDEMQKNSAGSSAEVLTYISGKLDVPYEKLIDPDTDIMDLLTQEKEE